MTTRSVPTSASGAVASVSDQFLERRRPTGRPRCGGAHPCRLPHRRAARRLPPRLRRSRPPRSGARSGSATGGPSRTCCCTARRAPARRTWTAAGPAPTCRRSSNSLRSTATRSRCRPAGGACPGSWVARWRTAPGGTPARRPAGTSPRTTTSATTSTGCSSTSRSPTRRPSSRRRTSRWPTRSATSTGSSPRVPACAPGMHVLEIGSGWGGFALYAAGELGCRVTTITISKAQADLARERIHAAGLDELVDVQLRDYREIKGTYDAVVSIEMLEAVGAEYYRAFFRACRRGARAGRPAEPPDDHVPARRLRGAATGRELDPAVHLPGRPGAVAGGDRGGHRRAPACSSAARATSPTATC